MCQTVTIQVQHCRSQKFHPLPPLRRLCWPMLSGDRWGLSFPDICLRVEENPWKKPQLGKLNRPGIEPGSARRQATMLPSTTAEVIMILILRILGLLNRWHKKFQNFRRQHACLSRSGPGFGPRSGQVSWVRFFRSFSSPVRQMSGSFRPTRSLNIICPS